MEEEEEEEEVEQEEEKEEPAIKIARMRKNTEKKSQRENR